MRIFERFIKPKKYTIQTQLTGHTAKARQEAIQELLEDHPDLSVKLDVSNNGTLVMKVFSKKLIGNIDSKIVRELEQKYTKNAGLSCSVSIGQNYEIIQNKLGEYVCAVVLTVEPE